MCVSHLAGFSENYYHHPGQILDVVVASSIVLITERISVASHSAHAHTKRVLLRNATPCLFRLTNSRDRLSRCLIRS